MYEEDKTKAKLIVTAAIVGVLLIILAFTFPFVIIDAGKRGVVMNYGKVQDEVLDEGIHWRTPFVQSVKRIDVRVQKQDVKAEAASGDLQDVVMDVTVNYHIDPKKVNLVYQKIGDNKEVFERIVVPNTNEVVKAATAQYTAENIIKQRQALKDLIDKALISRLSDYGIILDDVSLTNIDFSKEFNAAIEAKQVAEQRVQEAQFIADRAEKDAEAAINKAKGEAEAQRVQQQSLTPLIIQKMWIEAWNGEMPRVVTDGGLIMQIPQ